MAEMSEERLAKIETRCSRAKVGPWEYQGKDDKHFMSGGFIGVLEDRLVNGRGLVASDVNLDRVDLYATDDDMEFIAESRTDVPYLLGECRRLSAELSEANKRIEALRGVSIEHHLGESGTMICLNCGTEWEVDGPEAHGEDCPVAPEEARP